MRDILADEYFILEREEALREGQYDMSTVVKAPCDEGIIQGGVRGTQYSKRTGFWILVTTILGSSIAFIDSTVVNVALPVIQSDLHATVADAQWVVESYSLFLASLILVGGSLGDHFGRRRIFSLGIGIFAVASVICGSVSTIPLLILARALQGIGGALLVPGSMAIISASFSDKRRGWAIGIWSGFTSITMAIGPVLGGWLVEHASWRWVFFINIPLAIIVLILSFWQVPESRDEGEGKRLDWWGAALVTLGLGLLVYGLIEAGEAGFGDPIVLACLGGSILILGAFIWVEASIKSPLLPLGLFRSKTFAGANLLTLFLYAAMGGALFFFPFNLVQVQGYTTTAAGSAMLPMILLMFLLSGWAGGLVARYGAKLPLVIGPLIVSVGYFLFALPGIGGSYWTTYFPAVAILGLGMSISVAPLTTAVMDAVDTQRAGIASGINNAVARSASLLAIAVLGIVMVSAFNQSLDSHLSALSVPTEIQQDIDGQRAKLAGIQIPDSTQPDTAQELTLTIKESFIQGFRIVMYCATGLAVASAISAFILIEGKKPEAKKSAQ